MSTTVNSLASSILQTALSQVAPTNSTPPANPNDGATPGNATSGTIVTLNGNSNTAPLTYNAQGQLSSSQASALEQAIQTDASSTVSALFSGLPGNSGASYASVSSLQSPYTSSASTSATSTTPTAAQVSQALLNVQATQTANLTTLLTPGTSPIF